MARKSSKRRPTIAAQIRSAIAILTPFAEETVADPTMLSAQSFRWKVRKRQLAVAALNALENPRSAGGALWVAELLEETDAAVMAGDAEQAAFLASQLGRQDEGVRLFPTVEYAQERKTQPRRAANTKSQDASAHAEEIRAAVQKRLKELPHNSPTKAGHWLAENPASPYYDAKKQRSRKGWSWGCVRRAIKGMTKK
jgi:hypothetical protein